MSEDDFSEKKQEPENEEEATIKEEMDTPQEEQPMLPTDDSEQISPDKEEIEEIKATEQAVASSSEEGRAFNNQKGNSKAKGFFSLLAAGIFGSALTFFTIPHTDLYNDSYDKLEKQVAELSNKVESKTGAITASTTSNTATSDGTVAIADMVETSSKAIVGIENLQQQQSNPFSQESSDVESGSGSGIIFKKMINMHI